MVAVQPRVELYVRSLAPTDIRDQQERIVERLQSLDAEGQIRSVDITLCGECVCPSSQTACTDIGERLLGRYDAFQQWAEDTGRDLIGFEERNTESVLTGTTVTGIVFPRVTLAEYRGDTLNFVAPSANGTAQTSVADQLDTY